MLTWRAFYAQLYLSVFCKCRWFSQAARQTGAAEAGHRHGFDPAGRHLHLGWYRRNDPACLHADGSARRVLWSGVLVSRDHISFPQHPVCCRRLSWWHNHQQHRYKTNPGQDMGRYGGAAIASLVKTLPIQLNTEMSAAITYCIWMAIVTTLLIVVVNVYYSHSNTSNIGNQVKVEPPHLQPIESQ